MIYTTPTIPTQDTVGIVTAAVSCIREHRFQFDQSILEELNTALERAARQQGATAVVGVTYQLLMPTIHGRVQFQMTAFGTAINS